MHIAADLQMPQVVIYITFYARRVRFWAAVRCVLFTFCTLQRAIKIHRGDWFHKLHATRYVNKTGCLWCLSLGTVLSNLTYINTSWRPINIKVFTSLILIHTCVYMLCTSKSYPHTRVDQFHKLFTFTCKYIGYTLSCCLCCCLLVTRWVLSYW